MMVRTRQRVMAGGTLITEIVEEEQKGVGK